jgi:hypothetical protein
MSELDLMLDERSKEVRPLSKTSEASYRNQYNYITKMFGEKDAWVSFHTNKYLINKLKNLDRKEDNKLSYLNIFIMIKKNANEDNAELIKYREELFKKKKINTDIKLQEQKEILPSYNEVREYINDLYRQKDYVNYLINDLIFTYCLRNQDVNLKIINLLDYKQQKNNSDNFLVIKKTECDLIINSYKTKSVYGQKRIRIRSQKILNAIRSLKGGNLIQNDKGENVDMNNLSYYIRLMHFEDKRLTENQYCKINVFHAQTLQNPLQKIVDISKNRGTSVETLNGYYNFDKK